MARSADEHLAQTVASLALANARLSAALETEREKAATLTLENQALKAAASTPEGGA